MSVDISLLALCFIAMQVLVLVNIMRIIKIEKRLDRLEPPKRK